MIKIILLSLLSTLLIAQNPNIYSALGDVIYDNVEKIEKLKKEKVQIKSKISEINNLKAEIDKIKQVLSLKASK